VNSVELLLLFKALPPASVENKPNHPSFISPCLREPESSLPNTLQQYQTQVSPKMGLPFFVASSSEDLTSLAKSQDPDRKQIKRSNPSRAKKSILMRVWMLVKETKTKLI